MQPVLVEDEESTADITGTSESNENTPKKRTRTKDSLTDYETNDV